VNATSRRELVIAAGLVVLGLTVAVQARQIPPGVSTDPLGPAAFPIALGWATAICGVLLGAATLVFRGQVSAGAAVLSDTTPDDDGTTAPAGTFSPARLIGAIVATGAYLAVFTRLGYLISTPLYVAAIMRIHGGATSRSLLVAPLLVTAAHYATFRFGLLIPVPDGILESLLR
jgi:hypothetical protein